MAIWWPSVLVPVVGPTTQLHLAEGPEGGVLASFVQFDDENDSAHGGKLP